jgi:hypothetical protein
VRRRTLIVVGGIVVFAGVSFLVARYLTTEGRERTAVNRLLAAQARGDAAGMLAALDGSCRTDAACRTKVERNAQRLKRSGEPKIIAYASETAYALGGASGRTRVAWTVVDEGLPVVQCVDVRRGGSAVAGRTVTLLRISAPIGNEGSC